MLQAPGMAPAAQPPLCVDLDGTLLRTDTAQERFLLLIKREPWRLLQIPFWWWDGRPRLKNELAARTILPVDQLAVCPELMSFLLEQKASGRRLILVTGADAASAGRVARHFGLFEEVLSTDTQVNLIAENKRRRLVERFGERGFDYAGNSSADLAVWKSAREAIVVNAHGGILTRARKTANVTRVFDRPDSRAASRLQIIAPAGWLKFLLLLAPLFLGSEPVSGHNLAMMGQAILAFVFCAAGVSIRNALCDIEHDRSSGREEKSPFASGQIPIMTGLWLAPVLVCLGLVFALCAGPHFWFWPLAYAMLGVSANTSRPAQPMISDALSAAAGMTPLLAGFAIIGLSCPFWLPLSLWMLFLVWAVGSRIDKDSKKVS